LNGNWLREWKWKSTRKSLHTTLVGYRESRDVDRERERERETESE